LLAINLLSFFKKDSALKLETLKVGGPENMELVTKLYQSQEYIDQQTAAIDQALAQINMADNMPNLNEDLVENNNDDILVEETKNQSIIDELDNIKSSSSIYGKEDARFTILEYSELLCPYCKRHSDQLTLESVIKKFPNEVNTIFRNFIVH
jgi:protein-disulfide isomerase